MQRVLKIVIAISLRNLYCSENSSLFSILTVNRSYITQRKRFTVESVVLTKNDRDIVRRHEQAVRNKQPFYEDPKTKYIVWTREKHLERGKCCGSACRHVSSDAGHIIR